MLTTASFAVSRHILHSKKALPSSSAPPVAPPGPPSCDDSDAAISNLNYRESCARKSGFFDTYM